MARITPINSEYFGGHPASGAGADSAVRAVDATAGTANLTIPDGAVIVGVPYCATEVFVEIADAPDEGEAEPPLDRAKASGINGTGQLTFVPGRPVLPGGGKQLKIEAADYVTPIGRVEVALEGGQLPSALTIRDGLGFSVVLGSPPETDDDPEALGYAEDAVAYSKTWRVEGANPTTFATLQVNGVYGDAALPSGLSLVDNDDGTFDLSGTPDTPGAVDFQIDVVDDDGRTGSVIVQGAVAA